MWVWAYSVTSMVADYYKCWEHQAILKPILQVSYLGLSLMLCKCEVICLHYISAGFNIKVIVTEIISFTGPFILTHMIV